MIHSTAAARIQTAVTILIIILIILFMISTVYDIISANTIGRSLFAMVGAIIPLGILISLAVGSYYVTNKLSEYDGKNMDDK